MPEVRSEEGGEVAMSDRRVLCVDLDGTLVATDLLWESLLVLLRERPWTLRLLPGWLAGGKAHFKREVARRVRLDVESLPYRPEVLHFLRAEHGAGRELVLATAADESFARAVAEHLGIFSAVLASDGVTNLSGSRKHRALEDRFGPGGYDYAGNGFVDLPMWSTGGGAVLVAAPRRLAARVRASGRVHAEFPHPGQRFRALLGALRVHQWVKNLLIFVPVLLDHRLLDPRAIFLATLAFVAFCMAASGGYVLNDMLDLAADRRHPRKRHRPFAAGVLSLSTGALLVPALFVAAMGLAAATLSADFAWLLLLYIVLTGAYSFYLKRLPVVDVLLLAGLYTLRVLAGVEATAVRFSTWLLAFSMFLFLSLALLKRFAELSRGRTDADERVVGRGYIRADKEWLGSMGSASGYLSVLVLALYISSDEVVRLYNRPMLLWMVCPLLLFWVSRMWFLAHRGKIDEDPILETVRDRLSYVVGALVGVVLLAAL